MAFVTTLNDVHKNRPFKPRYARTQATAQAVVIADADAANIFPGCVLMRTGTATPAEGTGEVAIFKGAADTVPAGICGTFAEELTLTGQKDVAMWVLGSDAIFACSKFDNSDGVWTAALSAIDAGGAAYLTATASGLLTPEASVGTATDATVARLIGVEAGESAPTTILISGLF